MDGLCGTQTLGLRVWDLSTGRRCSRAGCGRGAGVTPQVPQAVVAHVAESTEEKQNLVSSSSWISFIVLYDALVPNQCRLKLSSDHRRPFFTKSADGGKGGAGGNFYQCFVLNILNGFKHASAGLFPTQIAVFRAPPGGGARIFHQMRPAGEEGGGGGGF